MMTPARRDPADNPEPAAVATPGEPVYPIPRQHGDLRFVVEMVADVGQVLEQHGYPDVLSHPEHLVALQFALWHFLYQPRGADEAQEIVSVLMRERYLALAETLAEETPGYGLQVPLGPGNSGPGGTLPPSSPPAPVSDAAGWGYSRPVEMFDPPPMLSGVAGYPLGHRY